MQDFREQKRSGEAITALTAYDYPTARLLDEAGIDIILVGDSLGMVVLGFQDTTEVTLDAMLHHTRAAARAVKRALLVADMPIHT
ncbi:MAG TPA: 3-methyl-2-oxobutanoate hydroxymethyltransferase, partial [Chthoniobacterales bacterium]